jgi:capsular polysaccharide biosynthesis protein
MVRVDIRNRSGSVEHYYHFLLGFCVPLVRFSLSRAEPGESLVVRECGPLTALLAELRLRLDILPVAQFHAQPATVQIAGFDDPASYDYQAFVQFARYVAELHTASQSRLSARPSVILIERDAPAEFYLSEKAEIRGAGSSRCAIKNHTALAAALSARLPSFKTLRLEGKSLLEQFEIFHNADIVIAQHGAALSNLLFMRRNTRVIEIGPLRYGGRQFSVLSRTMGLDYALVPQSTPFPVVDPDEIFDLI